MARKSAEPPGRDMVRSVVDEVSWYMTEHKVSRADLAHSMGVSPGRVSQILSGDEPDTAHAIERPYCPGREFRVHAAPGAP